MTAKATQKKNLSQQPQTHQKKSNNSHRWPNSLLLKTWKTEVTCLAMRRRLQHSCCGRSNCRPWKTPHRTNIWPRASRLGFSWFLVVLEIKLQGLEHRKFSISELHPHRMQSSDRSICAAASTAALYTVLGRQNSPIVINRLTSTNTCDGVPP